jgi:hypothetical protein
VRSLLTLPEAGPPRFGLVLAHGLRGDLDAADLATVCEQARRRGAAVLRFRFLFKEAGLEAPDPMPRLQEALRAATRSLQAAVDLPADRILLGGRSLGARVASVAAAAGEAVAGLVLVAYPLHPAGAPSQTRDAHLYLLRRPMLFFSGERDELADREAFAPVLRRIGPLATCVWAPGADHGLRPPDPDDAEAQKAILAQLGAAVGRWLEQVFPGGQP